MSGSSALTEREREVLTLLAQGKTNGEIGESLGISDKTARNTVSQIYVKLDIERRTQAVLRAIELGLVQVESCKSRTQEDS